jgi:LmbE family N-acetylglucosaminyl deacetylase
MNRSWNSLTESHRPHSIKDGLIDSALKLLVLAPHPDDFDAIGVTLKFLFSNGNPLEVAVAYTGSGVEETYRPGLTLEAMTQLRVCEQQNSLRFFGLPEGCLTFLRLENDDTDQLIESKQNLGILESIVLQKAPDLIFLPHGNDTNSAHRAMYAMVRQIAIRSHRPIALMLIRDPKNISMRTDLYLAFGEVQAAWKAELLRFHDSQQKRNLNARGYGFDKRILDVNRQYAKELKLTKPYAEVYELEIYNSPDQLN